MKVLFAVTMSAMLVGGTIVFAQQPKRPMPHGPGGMPMERELSKGAFELQVRVSPEAVAAGEELILIAKITSRTAPHTRVTVAFYRGHEKVEAVQGVIPPYLSETVSFRWKAEAGIQTLSVVLASAVGMEFARWEKMLEVKP
ncbi:MAG: hypothetical protein ACE5KI_07920 [Dehalococcoidia bacterium]